MPKLSLFLRTPAPSDAGRVVLRRSGLVLAGACLAPMMLGGCVISVDQHDGVIQRDEKRFKVASGGTNEITLVTFDGAVDVRGWDRDEVYVEVEKRGPERALLNDIEIVSEQQGNQIRIEARQPAERKYKWGMLNRVSRRVKLIASVPMGSNLFVRSGDGALTVERVKGRLDLRTSDGDLNGIDLTGEISARTGDGVVKFDGIDGKCDVVTGDGSVSLSGRFDLLRARTSDGSLTIKAMAGSVPSEEWHLQTGNGNVVFYLPDLLNAEVEAEAMDGVAKADPALAMRLEADLPKRLLRGTLGTGGPLVRVSTGDGSIVLKRLPASVSPKPSAKPQPDQPVERERPVDH
jgi:hypothetical protein